MNNNNLSTSMMKDMVQGLVKSAGDFRHGMSLGSKGSDDLRTLINELKGRMNEESFGEFVLSLEKI